MTKIQKLFDRRAETYAKYSDAIMDAITPNVVAAVIEHLHLTPDEIRLLQWTSISIIEDHLLLQGHIRNEEDIKLLRVPIPMMMVESASKEQVLDYLMKLESEFQKQYEDIYGKELSLEDLQDLEAEGMQVIDANELLDVLDGPVNVPVESFEDFEYNDLTDEQRERLRLSILSQEKGSKPN